MNSSTERGEGHRVAWMPHAAVQVTGAVNTRLVTAERAGSLKGGDSLPEKRVLYLESNNLE